MRTFHVPSAVMNLDSVVKKISILSVFFENFESVPANTGS